MKSNLDYLVALLHLPNLAINYGHKLWQAFPELADFFNADIADLKKLGIKDAEITKIKNIPWDYVTKNLEWAAQPNNHIICYNDSDFPPLLKQIPNPPLALFVSGDAKKLINLQLAIVGSRNPTPNGKEIAFEFAQELSRAGLTITSGFATGIDAACHQGAIAADGVTIAVMGTGLDRLYPKYHSKLATSILENGGVLVSEFPLGREPTTLNFPLRNRIISGLSLGTLVIEATLRSGSLITARLAAEQGREVFAIPGSIRNPLARGCHSIIRQGAKLVENTQDILEELSVLAQTSLLSLTQPNTKVNPSSKKNILDPNYKMLLECIGFEATAVDTLMERSKLTAATISSMLTLLELDGYIKKIPGGYQKTC